ncbi:DUF6879 family protein [Nonomuraea gerenzanensis]|uniref:DUF6879 domain-containing protein n=1 Tax=Nonomuraea gerenzanensis TaxID=93944 RepID=A0A1M4EJV2_9ACTN|nr:DUF6879 family protein [Nonomuraea gerenzanensis]UBU10732.1 hypothetical protein LCN96_41380 [Nonomuraea gerenzanensis]SBO99159.1 hypothetical protein BN4615_P8675 [Nonomuraea gerenzanensis]
MTEQGTPVRHTNPFAAVAGAGGVVMDVPEYQAGFERDHVTCTEPMWKLERAQNFYEPDVASWRAMMDGDWARSLALIHAMAGPLTDYFRRRQPVRRLRVVEPPITAYLQWEMHILALRAAAGSPCRVVPAARVTDLDPLPELVIFSPSLMYEVLYDEYGGGRGGRRITDRDVVEPCIHAVRALFDEGEDVRDFHEREIAPLPPPVVTDAMRAALPAYAHRTEEFRV